MGGVAVVLVVWWLRGGDVAAQWCGGAMVWRWCGAGVVVVAV